MTVGESLTALTRVRWRLAYELRADLDAGEDERRGAAPARTSGWLARFMDEFDAEEMPVRRLAAAPASEPPATRKAPDAKAARMPRSGWETCSR